MARRYRALHVRVGNPAITAGRTPRGDLGDALKQIHRREAVHSSDERRVSSAAVPKGGSLCCDLCAATACPHTGGDGRPARAGVSCASRGACRGKCGQ
jgi:hypothetical protein